MNCSKDPSHLGTGKAPENLGRGGNLYDGCCEIEFKWPTSEHWGVITSMGVGPTVDRLLTTSICFTCSSNLSSRSLIWILEACCSSSNSCRFHSKSFVALL